MGRLSCWGAVGVRQTRISNANVVLCRLCPSAAGPTSIAIVEGASRPSTEPGVAPGDACVLTCRPAEGPRVQSPDAPSPGISTSP